MLSGEKAVHHQVLVGRDAGLASFKKFHNQASHNIVSNKGYIQALTVLQSQSSYSGAVRVLQV